MGRSQILATLMTMATMMPLVAEAKPKGYYSMDAMGCMILRECTEGVVQVHNIDDVRKLYPGVDFDHVASEFELMVESLEKIGVKVFIGPEKFFPPGHRGVYHTVSNNFYLNRRFMHRPHVLMTVMRHEGWHAAQDCMAGSIKNSMIAIIKPEESVPKVWRDMVEKTYPSSAVPWEAEAKWAGMTQHMTARALRACAEGTMWEEYPPTPLTMKWLKENNYLD